MKSLNLDLTDEEFRRLDAAAALQPMSVEYLVSKLARQFIRESEDLRAQIADGPNSLDTR